MSDVKFIKVIAKAISKGEGQKWAAHVINVAHIVETYAATVEDGADKGAEVCIVFTSNDGYMCRASLSEVEAALVAGGPMTEVGK